MFIDIQKQTLINITSGYIRSIIFILMLFSFFSSCYAEIVKSTKAETNMKSWKISDLGVELELIQRMPEQTQAFFQARGFPREIANQIGNSCVLQTIAKNTFKKSTDDDIFISLKDWGVRVNGKVQMVKLKEIWDKEWAQNEITIAARLAFRWSMFPTEQTYKPSGDFNWGMTSIGLAPGEVFDLHVVWWQGKQRKDLWINAIQCPFNNAEQQ